MVSLLALAAAPAAAQPLDFACGRLHLAFDRHTGTWVGLRLAGSTRNLLAPADRPDAEIQGEARDEPGRLLQARRQPQGEDWLVEVERQSGPWRTRSQFLVQGLVIHRCLTCTWQGQAPTKVTGVRLRLPGVALGGSPDNCYLLPGDFPVVRHAFSGLAAGRQRAEPGAVWAANTGLALAASPRRRLAVLVGYRLLADGAQVVVEEGRDAVSLAHQFSTLCRLQPGESLQVGEQVIRLAQGGWDQVMAALGELAESLGNGPPPDRPAWVGECALYSCYPGGTIETGFQGAGGLGHLRSRLPYLAGLGLTALWLNPIHTSPPWIYSIFDYRALAPELGSREELAALVRQAHHLGLRVLLDLVPHGPVADSPAAREAPPGSWSYREDGSLDTAWGGLAADYSSRPWQRYMSEIAASWVREFGVDGYRVDCASGNAPNWRREDGRHPSVSSPLGGEELLAAVRGSIRPLNPDAVLFPEAWAPIWFRHGDLVYDYSFYQVMRTLAEGMPASQWVQAARHWLQWQRHTLPAAARAGLVRFVENHDTVRSPELWGLGPAQALTALCIFAQGTPLIYQDQEIGFSEELGHWLRLRRALPELHVGEADYQAVSCSQPGVLAFLRTTGGPAAVVAVSLLPHDAAVELAWPAALARRLPCVHSADNRQLLARGSRVRIDLPAYRPVVLLLRSRPLQALPTPIAAPAPPVALEQAVSQLPGGCREYRLRLGQAAWWLVGSGEGCLLDRFQDRHTAQPSPRFDFLWRPWEHGLWDGPGAPALGLLDAAGRLVLLSEFDRSRLVTAGIEDPSGTGKDASLLVVGRGEALPCTLVQRADGWQAVSELRRRPPSPAASALPRVEVDPLRVVVETGRLRMALLRRRGGLLGELAVRQAGDWRRLELGQAMLYTDWGLFEQGQVVGAATETNPRLQVARVGEEVQVIFTGRLHGPSWNGVQRGWPASPAASYRLTYRVWADRVHLAFALIPSTRRPAARAFFAYALPFGAVTTWWARAAGAPGGTADGQQRGRVFQTRETPLASARPELGFASGGAQLTVRLGAAGRPQNLFLLAGEPGHLTLYAAALEGDPVNLEADTEHTCELELRLP